MKNVLNNLEMEIKELKKDIKVKTDNIDIFDDNSIFEEEAIFEKQIELDKKEGLYKKVKNLELIVRDNGEDIDFLRIKDNKKNIKYCLYYFKATSGFSVMIYKDDKIISIDKDKYNNSYIMNSKKEGQSKYRTYSRVGKEKKELFNILFELYKLMRDTK